MMAGVHWFDGRCMSNGRNYEGPGIAQADLALNDKAANDSEIGRVVERISEPAARAG
jgi:hypothetical protein